MKRFFTSIFLLTLSILPLRADEGLWLLHLIKRLNYADMQKEGLKLTPEEIYSVNESSLKDAIVNFGGFCTGEIVSDKGLIFTNHHCGYSAIADLSTEKENHLKEGFWARNFNQELPAQGLYVQFLVKMGDVTERIKEKLSPEFSEKRRREIIESESNKIIEELAENGKYIVEVKSFFKGNEFYYFIYQKYTDIRLVGTPPASIGKFGGDTDNWEWPRHTGDFSVFRVYADKDGQPADYSPENIPLKPRHYLPISLKGLKPGDFSMVLGYPGSTERYMPSWGLEQALKVSYPTWVKASQSLMKVMKNHMNLSEKINIDYASDYARLANYWKNRIGMIQAIKKNKISDKKRTLENRFKRWYSADERRKNLYKDVYKMFHAYYKESNEAIKSQLYAMFIMRGTKTSSFARDLLNIIENSSQKSDEKKEKNFEIFQKKLDDYFSKRDLNAEKDLLVTQLKLYKRNVRETYWASEFKIIDLKYGGNFKKFADQAFSTAPFHSREHMIEFMGGPKSNNKYELLELYRSVLEKIKKPSEEFDALKDQRDRAYRLFVKGLQEMEPEKSIYPDANFSMRLSYGQVHPLPANSENDAKINYYTTLKGTVAKYKPGDEEFDLPRDLIELYQSQDYGPYADKEGYLPVNFLTNNDITGGNSGSPLLNARGELIGMAFDGNWEAMSGDIAFEKESQRTIAVDIRYVLFLIDKLAKATYLIDELKIAQ